MNTSLRSLWINLLLIATISVIGCAEKTDSPEKEDRIDGMVSEIKEDFAPDKRVALFEVEYEKNADQYILKGETDMPEAKKQFLAKLDSAKMSYSDQIKVLPDSSVENTSMGVISISVANLRGEGKHSAELVTQATLGMPVKVLKKEGSWYLIQTPDDYLAWVDYGGVEPMDAEQFNSWKDSEKIIFKDAYGQSYTESSKDSRPVSDLVAGSVLELMGEKAGFYSVKYPDGREAYVSKDQAAKYSDWLSQLDQSQESLVNTAERLMGLPYLWGGTSSKGVDCSGYTKTIYFMNGMILPRDASQQIKEGKLIDSVGDFEKLAVGDLLFFGKKATDSTKERVVHVGMWIGNNEFIHSAGDVHISSMDNKAVNFDEYNKNRYLRTKRVLGENTDGLTYLKRENIYMNSEAREVK
ncbi:MAG: SH3 domain-containing C40 family peptidase [Christiangramia sp.]|nr:SH3 domain-containing C40 family peptidase [Christiangramia sp.]